VRQSLAVPFKLADNHMEVRATRFRPMVLDYTAKQHIYPPLVFALIHTESAFNPRARSGVPAFGLMQLVPRSGARDAYRLLYGQDKLVTADYLYDPRNNIELGTAFVYLLQNRYLNGITNPVSRMYCTVAAYNTGAGNVSRAFTGGTAISRAVPVINDMSSDEVYERLYDRLPYEETRNYVKRVRERMPLYKAWKNE
jgi:membrane-bound lytic murein transglycosylase C